MMHRVPRAGLTAPAVAGRGLSEGLGVTGDQSEFGAEPQSVSVPWARERGLALAREVNDEVGQHDENQPNSDEHDRARCESPRGIGFRI